MTNLWYPRKESPLLGLTGMGGGVASLMWAGAASVGPFDLWFCGSNEDGMGGINKSQSTLSKISSPVQIPGDWKYIAKVGSKSKYGIKDDGTLWSWGDNENGELGLNQPDGTKISSPVQIPGTTWKPETLIASYMSALCCKTDGTLWSWGSQGGQGRLGLNQQSVNQSSPCQIPGTTWKRPFVSGTGTSGGIKTDGTLWVWGRNSDGALGQNNATQYSSPVQVPGTTWANSNSGSYNDIIATKTDGTLWAWGENSRGVLGQNNQTKYSSPVQIPGTTWSTAHGALSGSARAAAAIKTDGTLWVWGGNKDGVLGINLGQGSTETNSRSSPTQVGTDTTWASIRSLNYSNMAMKTDGTLWGWGSGDNGGNALPGTVGMANNAHRSSPVQVGSDTTWFSDGWTTGAWNQYHCGAIKKV